MANVEKTDRKVPPGDKLRSLHAQHGGCFKTIPYPPHSGAIAVLTESADVFGVTIWGLARLLGLPWLHQIYSWLEGSKKPSSPYMARLCWLHLMLTSGVRLIAVKGIDWQTGEIIWKERIDVPGDGSTPLVGNRFLNQLPPWVKPAGDNRKNIPGPGA